MEVSPEKTLILDPKTAEMKFGELLLLLNQQVSGGRIFENGIFGIRIE
jgi:hypothetical protein